MSNTISATELKNKAADVLNHVVFTKSETIIERYGKPIAKIVPVEGHTMRAINIKKAIDATFGSLPDFPEVTKFRRSRKKKFSLSL